MRDRLFARWTLPVNALAAMALLMLAGCTPTIPPDTLDPVEADVELRTFNAINQLRADNGLPPLVRNGAVDAVARAHSADMLTRDFFDHENPEGDTVQDRLLAGGVTTMTSMGENIAFASGFPDPVEVTVQGWVDSPGHLANILHPDWTHSGMGVARNGSTFYFTQVFVVFPAPPKSAWHDSFRQTALEWMGLLHALVTGE